MRMDDFMGKKVIGQQARLLGDVCDIEFDEKTMQITKICVQIKDDVAEEIGLDKSILRGSIKIDIPVTVIKAISDVVMLDRSAKELGTIAIKR
ncbi:MAG: hypothetical protein QG670_743 [Thermoproteota archaeon]|nr:hypothetical protein [Thermoproteota archaeon]